LIPIASDNQCVASLAALRETKMSSSVVLPSKKPRSIMTKVTTPEANAFQDGLAENVEHAPAVAALVAWKGLGTALVQLLVFGQGTKVLGAA
jgi:hypothetical protein